MRLKIQEEIENLAEQVTEGFKEWEKREHPGRQYGHDWQNNEEGAWRAAYALQQEKIEKLKKDNDLKDSWVKHHQKTVEIQLEKVAELNKQIESLKNDLDRATSVTLTSVEDMEIRQRHHLDKRERG